MALTIRKLQAGLVVAAAVLLAVVVWYVGAARRHLKNYVHDLAEKNGLDISNEGVSFSHTFGANTQFKLHAARQVTFQDGKMTLRDVGIELYGAKSNRSDHIHGSQFEYDSKSGVLVGVGDVFIDLAAPASAADQGSLKGNASAAESPAGDDSKIIHVKTSGVTFIEKEGSATTDKPVEFIAGGMTGNSVGASYDSKTGVIVLRSAVHLSGLRNERPVVVTAAWAEMDRVGDLVKLKDSKALLQTDEGARTVAADRSLIHMRPDGNPKRIDGEGHVVLTSDGHDSSHGVATGDRMQLDLNEDGQPQAGFLAGNVKFTNEAPNRQEDGRSQDVHMAFDAAGRPVHSVMTGDVEMNVHEGTGHRRLNAATVDMDLGGGGKAPVYVKGAVATGPGGAQLRLVDKSGKEKQWNDASAVRADVLVARFGAEGSRPAGKAKVKDGIGPPLEGLDGQGKTYVEQIVTDDKGAVQSRQTSTGDTLKVDFRTEDDGKIAVSRTEQRGGVTMFREVDQKAPGNKAGSARPVAVAAPARVAAAKTGPEVEHAKANVAVYEPDANEVTLTGDVQVQNEGSALFADKVVSNRVSGDSTAEGAVKVSYLQQGSTGEPMHVLAARAVSHKATQVTEFFAGPGAGARAKMWQGGSQVEAPVLDFDQDKRTVVAKDVPGGNGVVVKTVIVDDSQADASKTAAPKPVTTARKQGNSGPMRVWSQEMIYTDAARIVEFKGKVRADNADGELHAQDALVYLTQPPVPGTSATPTPAQSVTLGGRVDHMVAAGAIELDQPGRKATGEKLTYTASDQVFVLTGTKAAPPKMVDELQGTTTGAALRFRTGDDSVVVSSGEDAGHVRSETRMKQGNGKKP